MARGSQSIRTIVAWPAYDQHALILRRREHALYGLRAAQTSQFNELIKSVADAVTHQLLIDLGSAFATEKLTAAKQEQAAARMSQLQRSAMSILLPHLNGSSVH